MKRSPQTEAPGAQRPLAIAAWGRPDTPLLPMYHRELVPLVPLPRSLRRGGIERIEHLGEFWATETRPLRPDQLDDLVEIVRQHMPPDDLVIIPAGVSIALTIPSWPLRNRTRNGLLRRRALADDAPLTVGDFLQIPHLGVKSLAEFMCVAEAVLGSGITILTPNQQSQRIAYRTEFATTPASSTVLDALRPLLSAAAEFHNVTTLSEVLDLDLNLLVQRLGVADTIAGARVPRRHRRRVVYRQTC